MASLEDSSYFDSELLTAYIAFVEADTVALAVKLADAFGSTAVGANRTVRPEHRFDVRVCGFFVVKSWVRIQ